MSLPLLSMKTYRGIPLYLVLLRVFPEKLLLTMTFYFVSLEKTFNTNTKHDPRNDS